MRIAVETVESLGKGLFLSIQAQDFIEEQPDGKTRNAISRFLSIQAQDFIEESKRMWMRSFAARFLSIQAQDFIEETLPTTPIFPVSNS